MKATTAMVLITIASVLAIAFSYLVGSKELIVLATIAGSAAVIAAFYILKDDLCGREI